MATTTTTVHEGSAHVNGIDIHYREAGHGDPLILLHGGMVSTNPIWAGIPVAYEDHMGRLAERFRVIAPDTRGCGRTAHDGSGPVTYDMLADDVAGLIAALGLEPPCLTGFSDGGLSATVVGIRHPGAVRAIVNHAGYDFLNPHAATFAIMRSILGGAPDATTADPDAAAVGFAASPRMAAMFELLKADQDGGQGEGHWREYLRLSFHRTTQPLGHTFDSLAAISVPTLILVGDRDEFCSVEEGAVAYHALPDGELCVLPATGHLITPAVIEATMDFFDRRGG
jgi:pimeloyl-ACP methyl ester carboxylesterase